MFLSPSLPVNQVLTAMANSMSHLNSIVLSNDSELLENNVPSITVVSNIVDIFNNSEDFNILVQNVPVEYLAQIQEFLSKCQKKRNVAFVHGHENKRND